RRSQPGPRVKLKNVARRLRSLSRDLLTTNNCNTTTTCLPNASDILWFKQNFQADMERGIVGTAFDVDFLVAIACQETGDVWPILRKKSLSVPRVVGLCTLDGDKGRRAFPKTRADLLRKPNGDTMFAIARKALVDMAQYIPGFQGAVANQNKFSRLRLLPVRH